MVDAIGVIAVEDVTLKGINGDVIEHCIVLAS